MPDEHKQDDQQPLNIAPELNVLWYDYLTSDEYFFIRNHGDIPTFTPETYRLVVDGAVNQPMTLSLHDLQTRWRSQTLTVTMACAGNRRTDLHAIAPIVDEIIWEHNAIGNAAWTGASLADILHTAGLPADPTGWHVAFEGADRIDQHGRTISFGASISLVRALEGDVLLAWAMNDVPLSPARGYPVRIIVPGFIGARSVKWLTRITVQAQPSDNYYQQKAYRWFERDVRPATADWSSAPMIEEQPLNAVIISPQDGASEPADVNYRFRLGPQMEVIETIRKEYPAKVAIRGYAVPHGRHRIVAVEVSVDDGVTWAPATLLDAPQPHAWCRWQHTAHLPTGEHRLVVRATDDGGHTQPARPEDVWNFKGYLNNAWHRVSLEII